MLDVEYITSSLLGRGGGGGGDFDLTTTDEGSLCGH